MFLDSMLEFRVPCPPYHYALSSGILPPGLTLDPDTGVISGTPTLAGTYIFTVLVTDSCGNSADVPGTIVIAINCTPLAAPTGLYMET
jgi:hypothetical protein